MQMTFWCTVHSKTLVLSISSAAPAIKYGKTPLKSVDSARDGRCEVVRESAVMALTACALLRVLRRNIGR